MPSLQSALTEPKRKSVRGTTIAYETDGNAARDMSYEPEEQKNVGSAAVRADETPEAQEERRTAERRAPSHRKRTAVRPKVNLVSLGLAVAAAVISAALIYNYMRLTVLNDKIAKLRSEYQEIVNEGVLLKTQYESRYDLSQIEEYAQTKLGMTKMDRSQVEYVEIGNPDTIVRTGNGDGADRLSFMAAFTKKMNAILAFFS